VVVGIGGARRREPHPCAAGDGGQTEVGRRVETGRRGKRELRTGLIFLVTTRVIVQNDEGGIEVCDLNVGT
jgi:cation diffusion facilitator CzcD-associated flavoprotein CzcO